VTEVDHKLSD